MFVKGYVDNLGKQQFYGRYAEAMKANDIPKLGSRNFYRALDSIEEATNGEIVYLKNSKNNAKYCYLSRATRSQTTNITANEPKVVVDNPEIDFID